MRSTEFLRQRLINQQIASPASKKPQEIVSWLVAMQAQEYAMAKWAIGLRLPGGRDADIEKALNEGHILRTHLMRPTWHFVTPEDIRWLLALTAPHVKAISAFYYRKNELDQKVFRLANKSITKALQGGHQLNRNALRGVLEKAKIIADGERLALLLMYAELEGIICSGARQGKQFSYALLEERAPGSKTMPRDEALSTLVLRYFTSRGPATLQDFSMWSGLTMKDARDGIASVKSTFIRETIDGREYIFSPATTNTKKNIQSTFLLPDYDEYGISYKNRNALINPKHNTPENNIPDPSFSHSIVVDGRFGGKWKRTVKNNKVQVETKPFAGSTRTQIRAIEKAVKKYDHFVEEEAK
ncbi:MAG TPA: winged helix DNA-binding domain-containing protein [Puia sp.]|nr:winged helix DNA-binding domain-containing protein [Puia sp.]